MRGIILASVIVFVMACTTITAEAFSIERHDKLSKRAVKEFNQCMNHTQGYEHIDEKEKGHFVIGSTSEDNVTPTRVSNWHFYSHDNSLGRYLWFMKISFKDHFESIHNNLLSIIGSSPTPDRLEAYSEMGKLAHYLQDLANPSHVIPLFHGWPFRSDEFDEYKIYKYCPEPVIGSSFCKEREAGGKKELYKLLKKYHDNTLSSVSGQWSCFWKKPPPGKTFGKYNKKALFGMENPDCKNSDYPDFRPTTTIYDDFAKKRHREAINASIEALYYLQNKLNRP